MTVVNHERGVLITGATSGLGRATALRFAEAGTAVALVGRSQSALAATADAVRERGATAVPMRADLADTAALDQLVAEAASRLGGIGALVNAAATDAPGDAESMALWNWERVLAVNLTAPFVLARATMRHLRTTGAGGLIVNISSVAGRRGWSNASAYSASKFALTGLTQSLAAEGRDHDVRACLIYPGAMTTNWGTFDPADRPDVPPEADPRHSLDPATVADLIFWMATSPGRPVLNETTITPLHEQGWP
jgi:NAD(P)-dependent dehydrogenase (short-subunit alcohol dehydrogenase family)